MLALQIKHDGNEISKTQVVKPSLSLVDRRECRRAGKQGNISLARKGQALDGVSLVEYTTQGARVVLSGEVSVNQKIDFLLTTKNGQLDGYGRVAWTATGPQGQVAGLEFIDFTMRSRA